MEDNNREYLSLILYLYGTCREERYQLGYDLSSAEAEALLVWAHYTTLRAGEVCVSCVV